MNADIENTVKQYATCMEYQKTQPHEKTTSCQMPCKPWEVVDADIYSIKNNTLLCIVDYCSKYFKGLKSRIS